MTLTKQLQAGPSGWLRVGQMLYIAKTQINTKTYLVRPRAKYRA